MPKDYSPFTPGVPVSKELFIGRQQEVEKLRGKVAQAATTGRLQVAFLSGERGIGKSSLAAFVRYLVEKELRVFGIHAFLGGVSSLEEMVQKVFDRLLKESAEKPWYEKIEGLFGKHIKQVGLFGVSLEFEASPEDLRHLVNNFAPALRNVLKQLKDERKGLFIVLDDINGLAISSDFAHWLKSLVDEIATDAEPLPLCLLIVGYEERRQSLIELQPSLARIFDLFDVQAWSLSETSKFFVSAFSKVGVVVEEDALSLMAFYAGGLPVLAHEIGDVVFHIDQDYRIDADQDAWPGIMATAEIVGRKHLEPQVFRAIQSSHYLEILKKIVRELPLLHPFKRGEIRKKLSDKEQGVFDNFLQKMTKLGVVIREGRGEYRVVNLLHHLYFKMWAGPDTSQANKKINI